MTKELVDREEEVFIILGDTIFDTDYEFLKSDVSMIGVHEVEDPRRFGIVMTENDRITGLVEKPEKSNSKLAIVGLYYLKKYGELIDSIETLFKENITTKGEYQITDALNLMIKKGHQMGVFKIGGWFDCGKFDAVIETNHVLLDKRKGNLSEEQALARSGLKEKNNLIIEPCHIPANAQIQNSILGPYVSIGENVVINSSLLSNSIVGDNSELRNVNVTNSIIGDNTLVKGDSKSINIGNNSEVNL